MLYSFSSVIPSPHHAKNSKILQKYFFTKFAKLACPKYNSLLRGESTHVYTVEL